MVVVTIWIVKETGQGFKDVPAYNTSKSTLNKIITYTYDNLNKLIKEENSVLGNFVYEYENNSDILVRVLKNGSIYKMFGYTNNKRTSYYEGMNSYDITYDNYGNVTKHLNNTIVWNSLNQLASIGDNEYFYNVHGIRNKKTISSGVTKTYYLDGDRILGEDWSSGEKIRYFYNAEGIAGLRYGDCNFNFIKDSLGNVSKIMYRGKLIAEYNYDAWASFGCVYCKKYRIKPQIYNNY